MIGRGRLSSSLPLLVALSWLQATNAEAQPLGVPNRAALPAAGPLNAGPVGQGVGPRFGPQPGGGPAADFQSLIDLIVSTVAPDTWAETSGGQADIRPYVSGVYADAAGALRRYRVREAGSFAADLTRATAGLEAVAQTARLPAAGVRQPTEADARTPSALRFVSLGRLERELTRRQATGDRVGQDVLALAGLRRVRYVMLHERDVLLAGPAGDWRPQGDGRIVTPDTGEAVVRLDDLLTLLRRRFGEDASGRSAGPLGCSIEPRQRALAAAQQYLSEWRDKAVPPSRRAAWAEGLRAVIGTQDIRVFGVDPESRVAGVLIEADHHMKLVGMGLAEGVPGVESYLHALADGVDGDEAPTGGVLRWWFAMHYTAIRQTPAGDAFELVGPGVRVLSENEMLDERGQRSAAARADPRAQGFASAFSQHFARLCRKYPVYGELRNLFDLSLAVQLIAERAATAAAGMAEGPWRPTLLADNRALPLPAYRRARVVQTVVSHRVVNRRRFVVGVSGGVWADARGVLAARRITRPRHGYGPMGRETVSPPATLPAEAWWWDAP